MSNIFKMPSLGADMEACKLVEWLIKQGDTVRRGDVVAVVETQKGAIEIESFQEGTVGKLLVAVGETVPVGTPLAEIGAAEAAPTPETVSEPEPEPMPEPVPVRAPAQAERPRVSPAARRLAAEQGIDIAGLSGTGPAGAVVYADVAGAKAAPARAGLDVAEMRKAIARAMARSKREIPHYYLRHQIDMTAASRWLDDENAAREPEARLLMGTLLVKAVALALTRYPEFNGHYESETFHPAPAIHCGLAVAIRGGGLIAPAIHDCDRLPLDQLMAAMRDLVARVRTGRLRGSELADPTVTVTSLGERGVDEVVGVIYPPQVAIVGFGTVERRPVATESGVDAVPTVIATLAADHRISDGRRGALLLREIDKLLQVPEAL